MDCHARMALLAVAAAGVFAMPAPIAIAAPATEAPGATTTEPDRPTRPAATTTTTTTTAGPSCCTEPPIITDPPADPTLEADPTNAARGEPVTVRGSNWSCGEVTITPQRSASVTVGTSEHSFSTTITVPSDADFGSFSIAVTCDRWDQLTRTVTIRIARPPTVATTTTTSRTGVPVSEVEAQPSASQIAIPAPAPPSGSDPTRLVQDALALVGLLLAIAVATLVLHRRGRHLRRPAEPRLRVRVVEGAAPMIHVHRSGAMPALRVRLFGADPLLQIREIPR